MAAPVETDPPAARRGPAAPGAVTVELLSAEAFAAACARLGEILADAVDSGAGVSFLSPFTPHDGAAFWSGLVGDVRSGARLPLVARTGPDPGNIVGTVSLLPVAVPNQRHRADVSKLLVHRDHRRRGVARALMTAAAELAVHRGRTLLTLDCVAGGPAEALYRSLGFVVVGTIPGYAVSPTGEPEAAAVLYRDLT